jgi:hypothetical protein
MKFNVQDRFTLISVLPQQGPIATMKMTESLAHRLLLTVEEQQRAEIGATEQGGIQWKENFEVEIEISDFERQLIKRELKKLDEAGTATVQHIRLWDLFVGE